jgi:hypothetical protein
VWPASDDIDANINNTTIERELLSKLLKKINPRVRGTKEEINDR